jgi:hypothetical protein
MLVRPARPGVPGPLGLLAQGREAGELVPMAPVDGGLAKSQQLPVMRCSGEGSGSKVADWIWSGGEEGAHWSDFTTAEWINIEGGTTASQSGGREHGWNGRRGTPWWHVA